jgi:hypothetical protein
MLPRLFVSCLAIAPLGAQTAPPKPAAAALTAKSFLFDDAKNIATVDFAALRKTGVWDDLEVSVLKVAFAQMEKDLGFPLDALDRLTALGHFGDGGGMVRSRDVFVFEGNTGLAVPASVRNGSGWQRDERADGVAVWRRGGGNLFVQVRPDLQVSGHEDFVQPVLGGKPWSNRQVPDVMSLMSGAKSPLAWLVVEVGHPVLGQQMLGSVFPDTEWPEGDAPTFLCLRLQVSGDADDPHLAIEAVLRHQKGEAGLKVTQQAVAGLLERLLAMPSMRAAKGVLTKAVTRTDHSDMVVAVDLGRSRDAVGTLATLAMPLFGRAVEAVPARAVPPPPAEPKK